MKKRSSWVMWVGGAYLVLLVFFSFVGPAMRTSQLQPPGMANFDAVTSGLDRPFLNNVAKYPLGTDEQGRDILARLAQGGRTSLLIGLTVQGIALLLGLLVGTIGVYAPKWIREPVMRLTDAMFAFPDILLGMLLIGAFASASVANPALKAIVEQGTIPVIAALSCTAWPSIARLVRAQIASLKDREFVVAAKASGASTYYIVTRHVLPQLWGILLAVSMVELAGTILAEATLSFLGIGIRPPNPSWGGMLSIARQNMQSHPEMLIWPSIMLSITIFALSFVGDGLRALTDPKSK
ncbi:MAG: ABC transporter permease [Fimbriimonadaceae bacterium]|nr:ABC transporter permease [Fimbriimonadaceae bacterium]